MPDHDPLCPILDEAGSPLCVCGVLALVRIDERERIAAQLWPHVQPIAAWITGVNTACLAGEVADADQ